ncbi:FAD/FMN-containing dehydrogenase [Nocardiopsis arvandica]|uniref:FAD/FMN-containing dehydrogenase n=1 Tax=Nocardiopsis sinuspersici TaxID=501010 RepID=A0A7Y9XJI4_9ACTN|nr:FAD-binding protein [Nocardiopsis sinuspersici]NYH55648.1 FAD/FMN-containing dehydrogenase [Nocardiopsis sinuspersici]
MTERTASSATGPVGSGRPEAVTPDDPRYESLALRSLNERFPCRPESFLLAHSTEDVVNAVNEAVDADRRITVRSGGHCYEDFVSSPSVRTVIDLSSMDGVSFDHGRGAFEIGPGARLLDAYERLHDGWGVTLPGGASKTVAMGGHVQGGGYGALTRRHGTIVDHLQAVEVVVVDSSGRARVIVASREEGDPHRDLWWAHTGGGGGNFGVVTRYWFRTPGATGTDPSLSLPRPPSRVLAHSTLWTGEGMDRDSFRALVGNHGRWHELNSAPGSPCTALFSGLVLFGRGTDGNPLAAAAFAHVDADVPDARGLLDEHIHTLTDGVTAEPVSSTTETLPWLPSVHALAEAQDDETGRFKIKASHLRRGFDQEQIDILYDRLRGADHSAASTSVSLQSYGGRVNTVPPHATALCHRDSVLKVLFLSGWHDPALDTANLTWLRELYRDVHAATGGVPAPGEANEGCFVNFPDSDMLSAEWNTSGVPWSRLYYGDGYDRLRRVKARYDPLDVFHHAMSVSPAR